MTSPDPDPLPFAPESTEALRARFAAALEQPLTLDDVRSGAWLAKAPGRRRRCVFDCEDGVRLVVSREDQGGSLGEVVHVSASVQPDTPAWRRLALMHAPHTQFTRLAWARFRTLAGPGLWEVVDFQVSEGKGVPHWFVRPVGHRSGASLL